MALRLALLAAFLTLPLAANAQGWHPVWVKFSAPPQEGPPAETMEIFSRLPGTQTWEFRESRGPYPNGFCPQGCDFAVAFTNIPKNHEIMAWLKRGNETSPMSNIAPPGSFRTSTEIVTEACCAVTEFCCLKTDVNDNGVVGDESDKWICTELLAGRFQ